MGPMLRRLDFMGTTSLKYYGNLGSTVNRFVFGGMRTIKWKFILLIMLLGNQVNIQKCVQLSAYLKNLVGCTAKRYVGKDLKGKNDE